MNFIESMRNELTCPIDLDLFDDPITVPCCTKAFNRLALTQHLESSYNKKCPMCNHDLTDFDPLSAPKNVIIASMLDTFRSMQNQNANNVIQPH